VGSSENKAAVALISLWYGCKEEEKKHYYKTLSLSLWFLKERATTAGSKLNTG